MIHDRDFLADVLPTFAWQTYEIAGDACCAVQVTDEIDLVVGFQAMIPTELGGIQNASAWGALTFKNRPMPIWARDPGLSANVQHALHCRTVTYSKRDRMFLVELLPIDINDRLGDAITYLNAWTFGRSAMNEYGAGTLELTLTSLGLIANGWWESKG